MKTLEATERLYTAHPFGELDYDRERYFEDMLFTPHAQRLEPTDVVYDIGCGMGYLIGFLRKRIPNRVIGVDISESALEHCRSLGYEVYRMNNMSLDLPDKVSGFTVSNGVIHHTPDPRRSFAELVRITRPGKSIYVSVYRRHHLYHYLYRSAAPIRTVYRKHPEFVYRFVFPLFHVGYFMPIFLALEHRLINRQGAMTMFADQFLTPQATFHTRDELERWATEEKCRIVRFALEKKGQMISAIIERL
jgi:SAM-dependent methyltransferase